jgi:hypothetical protein
MWMLDFLPFWIFHLIVLVGVGGILASVVLNFIPFISNYKLPVQVASVILLVFGVYMEGGVSNQEKWEARVAEVKLEMAKKEAASAESSVKVVTKYITKVEVVKEKGDSIAKQIPNLISATADGQCVIPNGFVLLHDSASRNEVPDASGATNERASDVKLSGVGKTITENYTTYHQVAEQLRSLQEWVKEQKRIYNGD